MTRKSVKFPKPYIEIETDLSEQDVDSVYHYFVNTSKSEFCTPVSVRSEAFSGSTWIRFPDTCMQDEFNSEYKWDNFFKHYLMCEETSDLREFYEQARKFLQPYVFKIKSSLESYINKKCMVYGLEINMIPPGGIIKQHIDSHPMDEETHRVHLVLSTNSDAHIICNNEIRHFSKGKCFIFNNKMSHSVHNDGYTDRTHLVVDLLPVE